MNPMLADAINITFVLGFGFLVLVPLMVFEVVVEAAVLKRVWHIDYRKLCRFTLIANSVSLLAGIPVKILNSWLYGLLLPDDLPGFFARYPTAVAIGSFVYFVVTVGVEGAYAFRWLRRKNYSVSSGSIWKGILLANLASYIALAPLHYFLTQPTQQIREFQANASWLHNPKIKVIYTDAETENLKALRLDGSSAETIIPMRVKDYLVSADLNTCLFRGANGTLFLYRRDVGRSNLVWQTTERFQMNQVAFSPSARYVAFASEESNSIEVMDVQTGQNTRQPLDAKLSAFSGSSVAWSTNETKFYISGFENHERLLFSILPSGRFEIQKLTDTNESPAAYPCYGRIGTAGWYGSGDWGRSFSEDSCGDLRIWAEPGLSSHLKVSHSHPGTPGTTIVYLAVNPGLIHLARFYFGDVAFLEDCRQCLFTANGYVYVLDVQEKLVGTLVHGNRFILLTSRYQKQL